MDGLFILEHPYFSLDDFGEISPTLFGNIQVNNIVKRWLTLFLVLWWIGYVQPLFEPEGTWILRVS